MHGFSTQEESRGLDRETGKGKAVEGSRTMGRQPPHSPSQANNTNRKFSFLFVCFHCFLICVFSAFTHSFIQLMASNW